MSCSAHFLSVKHLVWALVVVLCRDSVGKLFCLASDLEGWDILERRVRIVIDTRLCLKPANIWAFLVSFRHQHRACRSSHVVNVPFQYSLCLASEVLKKSCLRWVEMIWYFRLIYLTNCKRENIFLLASIRNSSVMLGMTHDTVFDLWVSILWISGFSWPPWTPSLNNWMSSWPAGPFFLVSSENWVW